MNCTLCGGGSWKRKGNQARYLVIYLQTGLTNPSPELLCPRHARLSLDGPAIALDMELLPLADLGKSYDQWRNTPSGQRKPLKKG